MGFTFNFKKEHVASIIGGDSQKWYDALVKVLPKYSINTPERVAMFMAQTGHESGGFKALKENLNYSADSLQKVWPKRFDAKTANTYARNQEKIANKVYADRLGNGPESSGDGFKYRGRGLIQLTGKDNYSAFAKSIGKTLDETVTYCETLEGAIESACYFWSTRKLNEVADKGDVLKATKIINGGTIGLDDRTARYTKAKTILKG